MSTYFEPASPSASDVKKMLSEQLDKLRPKTKAGEINAVYAYIEDVYPDDMKVIVEVEGKKCYAIPYAMKGGAASLGKEATPLKEVWKQDGDPVAIEDIFKKDE